MAERSYRDLAAYWRRHFPVESDLPDERLVLRILKEYPSFGHDLSDLPDLYAKMEYDSIPLQRDWSEAKWQAAIEQWREALEVARTLNLRQLRRPSGIPIPLMGRRVGAAPSSRMLLVPLLTQEQTLWCWCACCAMVLAYYAAPQAQCAIANVGVGHTDCCKDPLPAGCNDTIWTIHPTQPDIITVYARFVRSATHLFGSISFDDLKAEVDSNPGRPVEVCYAWTGGDSHVALVCRYSVDSAGAQFVKVNDPADNIGLISFASLQSAYGLGSWVETFIKIQ
jgi:hypothetical protein